MEQAKSGRPWHFWAPMGAGPKAQAQLVPAQSSGSSVFPFKLPGFGQPATTGQFDASQRALIDKVNV